MYTFLGLQPHTKKQKKQVQKEKRNRIVTEMYVNLLSESLASKKRSWLKYIEEENKMHCVAM